MASDHRPSITLTRPLSRTNLFANNTLGNILFQRPTTTGPPVTSLADKRASIASVASSRRTEDDFEEQLRTGGTIFLKSKASREDMGEERILEERSAFVPSPVMEENGGSAERPIEGLPLPTTATAGWVGYKPSESESSIVNIAYPGPRDTKRNGSGQSEGVGLGVLEIAEPLSGTSTVFHDAPEHLSPGGTPEKLAPSSPGALSEGIGSSHNPTPNASHQTLKGQENPPASPGLATPIALASPSPNATPIVQPPTPQPERPTTPTQLRQHRQGSVSSQGAASSIATHSSYSPVTRRTLAPSGMGRDRDGGGMYVVGGSNGVGVSRGIEAELPPIAPVHKGKKSKNQPTPAKSSQSNSSQYGSSSGISSTLFPTVQGGPDPQIDPTTGRKRSIFRSPGTASSPDLATMMRKAKEAKGGVARAASPDASPGLAKIVSRGSQRSSVGNPDSKEVLQTPPRPESLRPAPPSSASRHAVLNAPAQQRDRSASHGGAYKASPSIATSSPSFVTAGIAVSPSISTADSSGDWDKVGLNEGRAVGMGIQGGNNTQSSLLKKKQSAAGSVGKESMRSRAKGMLGRMFGGGPQKESSSPGGAHHYNASQLSLSSRFGGTPSSPPPPVPSIPSAYSADRIRDRSVTPTQSDPRSSFTSSDAGHGATLRGGIHKSRNSVERSRIVSAEKPLPAIHQGVAEDFGPPREVEEQSTVRAKPETLSRHSRQPATDKATEEASYFVAQTDANVTPPRPPGLSPGVKSMSPSNDSSPGRPLRQWTQDMEGRFQGEGVEKDLAMELGLPPSSLTHAPVSPTKGKRIPIPKSLYTPPVIPSGSEMEIMDSPVKGPGNTIQERRRESAARRESDATDVPSVVEESPSLQRQISPRAISSPFMPTLERVEVPTRNVSSPLPEKTNEMLKAVTRKKNSSIDLTQPPRKSSVTNSPDLSTTSNASPFMGGESSVRGESPNPEISLNDDDAVPTARLVKTPTSPSDPFLSTRISGEEGSGSVFGRTSPWGAQAAGNRTPLSPQAKSPLSQGTSGMVSNVTFRQPPSDDADLEEQGRVLACEFLDDDDTHVAHDRVAEYLGGVKPLSKVALKHYMDYFDFTGLRVDEAFRQFCQKLYLKAETQEIDRILEGFSERYVHCNPHTVLQSPTVVHVVTGSFLLLNTDLHIADIAQHMSRNQFIRLTIETIHANLQTPAGSDRASTPELIRDDMSTVQTASASNQSVPGTTSPLAQRNLGRVPTPRTDSVYSNQSATGSTNAPSISSAPYLSPVGEPKARIGSSSSFGSGLYDKGWEADLEGMLKDIFNAVKSQQILLPVSNPINASRLISAGNSPYSSVGRRGSQRNASGQSTDRLNALKRGSVRGMQSLLGASPYGLSHIGPDGRTSPTPSYATSIGEGFGGMSHLAGPSLGFASNLSHSVIREQEDEVGSTDSLDTSGTTDDFTDDELALLGAPWAKEGNLSRKFYWDAPAKRSKEKNWKQCFAVIQKGDLHMFTFGEGSSGGSSVGVGGGNWMNNAKGQGEMNLSHSLTSALPPPGYNSSRPYCFSLTLPNGEMSFFQAGTEELVQEWVATCNYWAARRSRPPLPGGVGNVEHGWSRVIGQSIERTLSRDDREDAMSLRSNRSGRSRFSIQGGRAALGVPVGDRIHIADWKAPQASLIPSPLDEEAQLESLQKHVVNLVRDLDQHKMIEEPMNRMYSARSANATKAKENWRNKSFFIHSEIVKYETYVDALKSAISLRLKKQGERKLEKSLAVKLGDNGREEEDDEEPVDEQYTPRLS